MMAIDLLSMKTDAPSPSNVNIIEVKDGTDFESWCHIVAEGFGIPDERRHALSKWFTIGKDFKKPIHFYLVFQDGEPVATSQLLLAEGVAGIFYVATLPEARNQGIGYAISLKPL